MAMLSASRLDGSVHARQGTTPSLRDTMDVLGTESGCDAGPPSGTS
jgi:hypothetical protein